MTRQQVIEYVTSLIDEISPSGTVSTMGYNKTIEKIMQSVADEYAMLYPAVSPITKNIGIGTLDFVSPINSANTVMGTRIKLNGKLPGYVKLRGITLSDGQHKFPDVFVSETFPMTGKKRLFIDGNNLKSLSVLDTVLFYQDKGATGEAFVDIFPNINTAKLPFSYLKYDSTFSTGTALTDAVEHSGSGAFPPSVDRGFFDNFCWYLAYRSMQVMGSGTNMLEAAGQKVQAHFEIIKTIP